MHIRVFQHLDLDEQYRFEIDLKQRCIVESLKFSPAERIM